MPLGNGPPGGLPSLSSIIDPRKYDTPHSSSGDTTFNPITRMGLATLGVYEKVIAATPGLAMWWPLGYAPGGYSYLTYGNAVGAATLLAKGSGTDTLVAGIVPGCKAQAVRLAGGRYLAQQDYRVWPMSWETLMSVEFWVYFSTVGTDAALVGEWDSLSNGWMAYSSSGDLRMYCGGNHISQTGVFTADKTYHVVCVWGGSQRPTADYVSRAYVNGVEVLNGNLVVPSGTDTITRDAHFQVNAYGSTDGGGSGPHSMTIQHISIYNRMLQPAEVLQHYAAGFARG